MLERFQRTSSFLTSLTQMIGTLSKSSEAYHLGLDLDHIRHLGRWSTVQMKSYYAPKLPTIGAFCMARFRKDEPYFIERDLVTPPLQLRRLIFPWIEDTFVNDEGLSWKTPSWIEECDKEMLGADPDHQLWGTKDINHSTQWHSDPVHLSTSCSSPSSPSSSSWTLTRTSKPSRPESAPLRRTSPLLLPRHRHRRQISTTEPPPPHERAHEISVKKKKERGGEEEPVLDPEPRRGGHDATHSDLVRALGVVSQPVVAERRKRRREAKARKV
ncbi:hypothetical protein BC939DRAFT_498773 [Gamsiella multidivaricata]|uniref:uncharacterized protein n=1 Tax=Gamsiella multidivaricata TaxID=101098 RepID=UPI00222125F5|nr:uncharacterized protein BC939DRAFT_498773 [Gamsiella multidivaricata]KAI7831811.1 hypothetical protein BC939DRAFT_498773 [Gamsiella multidivaricata]